MRRKELNALISAPSLSSESSLKSAGCYAKRRREKERQKTLSAIPCASRNSQRRPTSRARVSVRRSSFYLTTYVYLARKAGARQLPRPRDTSSFSCDRANQLAAALSCQLGGLRFHESSMRFIQPLIRPLLRQLGTSLPGSWWCFTGGAPSISLLHAPATRFLACAQLKWAVAYVYAGKACVGAGERAQRLQPK